MSFKAEKFNEATRVQIPALVHLLRIGYRYYGKMSENNRNIFFDSDTNILINVFKEQYIKFNQSDEESAFEMIRKIKQELDFDDLGKSFYNRLLSVSPYKLIDFDNIENNVFHFTAEMTYRRDYDEFRPDITLFVNGLPLVFIEVKKPNNPGGMISESERMNNNRFTNKKFRRFINITQLMIFSNNMEYDTLGGIVPIQGAFYCSSSRGKAMFNCFREENSDKDSIAPFINNFKYDNHDETIEKQILKDYNCQVIRNSVEYQINLDINTPTNRILTSLCSPERLLFLIRYGFAYVKMEREIDGKIEFIDEKHIIRYQQLFALLAVKEKLSSGKKSGVIWHTQGSGKTALSFHLTKVLTDFYSRNDTVTKFYFIVDRLDLLEQASQEFEARGVEVKTANTRNELLAHFRVNQSLVGNSGNPEITVVNIQRFAEDNEKIELPPYATNLQRIFIIDEAHRGYNPRGSFLANLLDADPNAVKIALTGTPLLSDERASWAVFGDYFHTYYYDKSIQDGYTLKIIREDIQTSYRENLSKITNYLEKLISKKDVQKNQIIEHDNYVKELIRYIINDMKQFRLIQNDNSLGGMIICESSEQARKIALLFNTVQSELNSTSSIKSDFKVGLILHDSEDKESRKKIVKDFKKNMTIDILVVFNMLLTGFDAPRLKRLYFGRKLKDHNLLQAITRVNRPYKKIRYGYIIDFADIKKNFEETNQEYLKELNRFNNPGDTGIEDHSNTFMQIIEDKDNLIKVVNDVKQALFEYTTSNLEVFSSEISRVDNKSELLNLKRVLTATRDYYNIVRSFGDVELKEIFKAIDISKLAQMINEVQNAINSINQKEMFKTMDVNSQMINQAMLDIVFDFKKIGEEELSVLVGTDNLNHKWRKVIESFHENIDQEDPKYISLREAFILRFKEHGFVINDIEEYKNQSKAMDEVLRKLEYLKEKNDRLREKYKGDVKFVRVHKRIREENESRNMQNKELMISKFDDKILEFLSELKDQIDQKVLDRNDILRKDSYFEQTVMSQISEGLGKLKIESKRDDRLFVQSKISREYLMQYNELFDNRN